MIYLGGGSDEVDVRCSGSTRLPKDTRHGDAIHYTGMTDGVKEGILWVRCGVCGVVCASL